MLHVGAREAGYIKMGPKIDEVWVLKSMIFAAFFDRFFVDFMFNFVSWPGRPDKRRTHTEHTQSTHTEQLSPRFPFLCQDRFPRQLKRGSGNEVENNIEKVVPKGPRMDPKS